MTGGAADRAPAVSWFDVREVTLGPADLAGLDPRERARAAAFTFPADRRAYQAAHVLLRRVLASHLGTGPAGIAFARQRCPACGGPSGRPVLAGPAGGGPFFSLAHSGDMVAIAVAGRPVGIDVEQDATRCVCALAGVMHPGDAALAGALPEPRRHAAVIRWWVRAEAALKCAGTGITHGMGAFPVLGGPVPGGAWGCSVAALPAPRGYQAALALPGVVSQGTGGGEP